MINISPGKIRLEDKIIDLSALQVRPKVTEQDLEGYYNSFIAHVQEIRDYFEDTSAFERAVNDAACDKKPKLVARETRYPFLWGFKASFMPFNFLNPSARRLHDDYFMVARCITSIPKKTKSTEEAKPLDETLCGDITKKFKQYPGYEGIIEIPNNRTSYQTKSTTFHESIHYLIARYQAETGRNFAEKVMKEDSSQLERYQMEHLIHERAVEILTDKLLTHDPDAQFEGRWLAYSLDDGFGQLTRGISALATGLLGGFSTTRPHLLPLVLVPGRIKDYVLEKHKKSKRDELSKPVEYPKFKI